MYGMVNQAAQELIESRFGAETWQRVKDEAKLGSAASQFQRLKQYPDEITYAIVAAASDVLNLPAATVLETFGEFWIEFARRSGYEITGIGGKTLTDHWADGMRTLHGFSANGFPNLFVMGLSQNGFSVNLTSMLDDQAQHVAYIINETNARGARYSQPTAEAEADWVDTIHRLAVDNQEFFEACTPGYYNNEGQPSTKTRQGFFYMGGPTEFVDILEGWRQDGKLAGLEKRSR